MDNFRSIWNRRAEFDFVRWIVEIGKLIISTRVQKRNQTDTMRPTSEGPSRTPVWCDWYTRTIVVSEWMKVKMLKDDLFKSDVMSLFHDRTMSNLSRCKDLLKKCETFDVEEVITRTVMRVIDAELKGDAMKSHLVWAPTQSGKSAYKALELACYMSLNVLTILCTKGKSEARGLASKLKLYFKGSTFEERILDVYDEKSIRGSISKFADKNDSLGCTLIIPDTNDKMNYAHDVLVMTKKKFKRWGCPFRVVLILDECDAIEGRSMDKSQENEKAMMRLRSLGMTIETKVTATPLPVIFRQCLTIKDGHSLEVRELRPQKDYVEVGNLELTEKLDPESMDRGFPLKKSFCHENNKNMKGLFRKDKQEQARKFPKCNHIPAWDKQCNKLVESAFEDNSKSDRTGVLILVLTLPWVEKKSKNIFQQAAGVQDFFGAKGFALISVVVHAGKIFYRFPGLRYPYQCRAFGIDQYGEFLGEIDEKFGLKVPVIVFGYHALKRSTSWRSKTRVPTHLIMYHREGQSIENVVQAAGRATGNFRKVLFKNMKRNFIPTAMIEKDFTLVQKHDKVVRGIIDISKDESVVEEKRKLIFRKIKDFREKTTKRKSGVVDFQKHLEKLSDSDRDFLIRDSVPPSKRQRTGIADNEQDEDRSSSTLDNTSFQQQHQQQPQCEEQEDDLFELIGHGAEIHVTDTEDDIPPFNKGSESTLSITHEDVEMTPAKPGPENERNRRGIRTCKFVEE